MSSESDDKYLLKGLDADAVGVFTEDGFIIQSGSIARREMAPSLAASTTKDRGRLLDEHVLEEHEGQLRFTQFMSNGNEVR